MQQVKSTTLDGARESLFLDLKTGDLVDFASCSRLVVFIRILWEALVHLMSWW